MPANATGEDIYHAACVTCHGPDGRGAAAIVGFETPLPDFTDCAFATAEPDPDWLAVVHEGGPIRGLDRHMPAFGDALSTRATSTLAVEPRADVLHGPGVAARRPELAARVLHREGVSRERGRVDDRRSPARRERPSGTSWSTNAASARATRSK